MWLGIVASVAIIGTSIWLCYEASQRERRNAEFAKSLVDCGLLVAEVRQLRARVAVLEKLLVRPQG